MASLVIKGGTHAPLSPTISISIFCPTFPDIKIRFQESLQAAMMPTSRTSSYNTFRLTNNRDRRTRNQPHGNSLLESLSTELLQYVAHLAPTSAASSLALCNKYICNTVGPQYWSKLRSEPLELETFLGLFEKDNPRHWLCHSCRIFHLHQLGFQLKSGYQALNTSWKCVKHYDCLTGCVSRPFSDPSPGINHFMVQMAMNRHLWGPDHGLPLKHLSVEDDFSAGSIMLSTEARIFAEELYLRSRYQSWIPTAKDSRCINPILFCGHLRYDGLLGAMTTLVKCKLEHRNQVECERCKVLTQCTSCDTEVGVEIHKRGSLVHILEFTSWKNFGQGRTSKDPKWLQHVDLSKFSPYRTKNIHPTLPSTAFSPGSIRAAFEFGEGAESDMNQQSTRRL